MRTCGGGDAQAVDLIALGARRARDGGGDGAGGGGSGDGAVPAGVAQAAEGRVELGLDVLVHLVELADDGRIVLEKNLAQADGAQGLGEGFHEVAAVGGDDLRAAAADIDDEDAFVALRPDAFDAEVDQARLFAAGDDFDGRAGGFGRARQELVLVAGVADGAGGDGAHAHHIQLAVERRPCARARRRWPSWLLR